MFYHSFWSTNTQTHMLTIQEGPSATTIVIVRNHHSPPRHICTRSICFTNLPHRIFPTSICLYGPWLLMWQIASRPLSWYLSSLHNLHFPCDDNRLVATTDRGHEPLGITVWHQDPPAASLHQVCFKATVLCVAVKPCHPVEGSASEHIRFMSRSRFLLHYIWSWI